MSFGSGTVGPIDSSSVSGTVSVSNFPDSQAATGTFFQATQPVSLAANQSINEAQIAGTAIATGAGVTAAGVQRVVLPTDQSALPVTGAFFQATQPVSAASLPLPTGAATAANQTNGSQTTQVSNFPASQAVTGSVSATPALSTVPTYIATVKGLVPASAATDIFLINGSATKLVQITRLSISGTQTVAGSIDIKGVLRSSANTGGTSAAQAGTPYDSNNLAATATVVTYTANPTVGGTVGTILIRKQCINTPTSTTSDPTIREFGTTVTQVHTLLGVAQGFAVNLGGATVTGGSFDISVEWTES